MNVTALKEKVRSMSPEEGLLLVNSYKDTLKIDNLLAFIEKEKIRLNMMSQYENMLYEKSDATYIAGVDEVGRGPLAGPVVVASVVLPKGYRMTGINDSKKVSEKNREKLSPIILRDAIAYKIVAIDNNVIDDINILQATKRAMYQAIENIEVNIDCVLIDAVKLDKLTIKQIPIIKGDEKSISIAAASIIAKVYRDNILREYDKIYPEYNFKSNKGYGSSEHINAIKKYGLTDIHRRSFTKNIV